VLLPACDAPAEQFPEDEQSGWNWHGSGRVLVIDDEETVRTVSARILEALGFSPVTAKDGREGAEVFHRDAGDFRLVLTDLTMPNMDGAETCRRIRSVRGDIPIVLMSGYWEEQAKTGFDTPVSGFLKKPFSPEQLRDQIRSALSDGESGVREN
jgi:two-component system cell cycle sensor histidine kinase/response regulator CckA